MYVYRYDLPSHGAHIALNLCVCLGTPWISYQKLLCFIIYSDNRFMDDCFLLSNNYVNVILLGKCQITSNTIII